MTTQEQRILELERTLTNGLTAISQKLQEHLQEHQQITKDIISDEILNKLKFNVQYTD